MHEFYEYLATQLAEKLTKRRVVVWYDARVEFEPFIRELGRDADETSLVDVVVSGVAAKLCRWRGSYFGIRQTVEPLVGVDTPEPLLIYIPGREPDRRSSLLMELELAGERYEPQLKRLARNVLRRHFSDGEIDPMLAADTVTYGDVTTYLEQARAGLRTSVLTGILGSHNDPEALLAYWLATPERDASLAEKSAEAALASLIQARLGPDAPRDVDLARLRELTARYALAAEFRDDLLGPAPDALSAIRAPQTAEQLKRCRAVAEGLRREHADAYPELADRAEAALGLSGADVDPACLGSVDTFRFEERALLAYAGRLVAAGEHGPARAIVDGRSRSFWADRDTERQAQWEACGRMADLGIELDRIRPEIGTVSGDPDAWIHRYAADGGWHLADGRHRQMEAWISRMDVGPECAEALVRVRQRYEDTLRQMTEGFVATLAGAGWSANQALRQTDVHADSVARSSHRTAYFLVDALRFEMGAELCETLTDALELTLQPAVACLPTITVVGMAALMPGASGSLAVSAASGKLVPEIGGRKLGGLSARQEALRAAHPTVRDLPLDDVIAQTTPQLERLISDAALVVVRSSEIDAIGESGSATYARWVMDVVLDNIARAVRKLSECGIERFVISADHGHLFAERRQQDMRMDPPGGDTVELHRRCWVGRGGAAGPATVRVSASELGYPGDLEFIFPTGLGVFRCGGDVSYHHGGPSLQELIVPVISFRSEVAKPSAEPGPKVVIGNLPPAVTNRIFNVQLDVSGGLFALEGVELRVVLRAGDRAVGTAGMAMNAELDRASGVLRAPAAGKVTVGMMLNQDDCKELCVVVLDAGTDAVLAKSGSMPVKLGI